ncbi:MAG TPA: type I restriction endonuclease subunit R [Hyphomonadaceae bacterium]|uniref:type I restriction endonuclease subunit R n=1 Tax=Hyphomonadaceae TaxID=69657 RepID=UPI000458DBBF|nr:MULTISPECIES: type I restriction endonuclease [Hyphomonadaceae]MAN92124.1 type I restriction endonuclease subunit R [Hyphomonadaceae bacterium]OUY01441.1 MAG: DEAD/DEAH box helicase [Hyphomonadaceae bacterium TMED5]HAQ78121.1 type I restriction endonuclease subunit R [Hyphomonas sp.]KCZ48725.1 DEAD/DEAH box helicase [Hyphomonas sp. CY54-11-8]MAF57121.1 type I restriction endonuclease subunit R [Ponticaulis sp.]|tara:strand:+ start:38450 stop:41443 length:2994 start_codon:yes stop_codon:yes gene_type:complete
MTTYTPDSAHREKVLQDHLIDQLVSGEGYLRRDAKTDYDRALAMDRDLVVRFLSESQPEEWEKLTAHYSDSAEDTLFTQLTRALKERDLLDVLRQGLKIVPGIKFSLCYFRPASTLEPKRVEEYQANILSVMDEVAYSSRHESRIDVVLFLNGLPVATIEAKNLLTGSTFRHAEKQYRKDRSPAGEPLLTFQRGALVHFAMDEDNVSMTTRLANGKTRFLPFNRGRERGAGNPDVADEFRVAYLYRPGDWGEAIFSRRVLLEIVGQFMHVEKTGKDVVMIFPRFQQLDAVRRLISHAGANGPGRNYLIQHSAGSGKSNTIGWLAHQAINLHDGSNTPVFNTAIIVTDRVVLDRQLQETVAQFEQTKGLVKTIDGTSKQLKEAIAKGARIIVTTIQKFSTDHLKAISGQGARTFAVIIDEAHSSQSGKSAQAMTDALTRDETSSEDIEDLILDYQKSRGPQANLSFFAFTATPRNVTLERFGVKGSDGLPVAFHEYSMRQAIEEGFILDVLQNYMTYKAYYQLEKTIEDDPELSGRRGQRKVARFASLHPTAIGQKVEIIVEHFRRHVMGELGGQAKAMIVTQSREHALRYYFGIKAYLDAENYGDLRALVAFSGELTHEGETYTEADLNGFSETELPGRFDGFKPDGTPYPDTYQILIVAEKYQTGFDQPKLCAMYIDRKLAGLQAVQTLSRLNRTKAGKENTYILDFQNTMEDIQTAFRPFYEATSLEAMSDPNQVYELEGRLFKFGYLDRGEIDRFAETFYSGALSGSDRARLEGLVREAVQRFEADEDEGRQEEFRQLLKSYMRFYGFVAQVIRLEDTSLEKLYSYASWLSRLLPNREVPPDIEITQDMLRLQAFKVVQKEQGSASLSPGDKEALKAISEFGAKPYTEDEQRELSEIVKAFNDRHGTEFTENDFIRYEPTYQATLDDDMTDMLRNNAPDVVYSAFSQAFFQGAIRMFQRDNDMRDIVLTDPAARDKLIRFFFNRALREVKGDAA